MFDFLQHLFSPSQPATPVWRPTALTPAQAVRHARWVEQHVYLNWLGPYFKAYHLRKGGAGGVRGLRVQQLQEPGRQGALFFYDPSIGPGNFRHFYEHLGERVLGLGYHRACADLGTRRHAHHTETTLKQLFKPDPTDCPDTGRCDQRYGLITVDLVTVDGQPAFIRLAANAVLESCFTPANTFDALAQALLSAPEADAAVQSRALEYWAAF